MIKKLVFTLVLLTVSISANAMTVSQQWSKVYGGDNDDYIVKIIQTIDGGFIASGGTKSFGAGGHNMWILKLDSNGEIEWQKTYGLDFVNDAYSMKQTSDGGYIIVGAIGSFSSGASASILKLDRNGNIAWQRAYSEWDLFKGIEQTSDGGYIATSDAALLKLDSTGNAIWAKQISSDSITSIQQTSDGGFIIAGFEASDFLVLKVDSEGNTLWGKQFHNIGVGPSQAYSIQQTRAGGYIVAGMVGLEAWILKLDSNGTIIWQKAYGGTGRDYATSVKEVMNGYIVVGSTDENDNYITKDMWVLQLDTNGDILWQKTYGSSNCDAGVAYQTTTDGGIILAGNTLSFSTNNNFDFWLLKLDSNGEIPNCDVIYTSEASVYDTTCFIQDRSTTIPLITPIGTDPNITLQNSSADTTTVCYYENPNDIDGDGIENTPGGTMASSIFLADEDNCPDIPNGPYLGTCIQGNVGSTCISDAACGVGGVCSMAQEDNFPPGGNGIGDACDCECDFDCSGGVDANDVTAFLGDFGRSQFNLPCTNADPCNGDVDCSGGSDAFDVGMFLEDFGRSQFNNPCPTCVTGPWCVYP